MELLVTIRDKIATYAEMRPYVCGNSDYVIHFDMDEEWAAHETKTARFVKDDGTYHDQVFTGNDCPVPVISNTFGIRVGVFAGDLHTTTPAYIPAKKSILCGSGLPQAPSDDVYAQIMEHLNQIEQNGVSDAEIKAAIEAYLIENPIEGVTPEEVAAEVNKALEEAKASGAFKGDKGDKGDQGEPGKDGSLYELPTASADTKGGVKVGAGLQMDGDVLSASEGEYELIETITVTEKMAQFVRDYEPSGAPYNFKALLILINATAEGSSTTVYFQHKNSGVNVLRATLGAPSKNSYAFARAYLRDGVWCNEISSYATEKNMASNKASSYASLELDAKKVNSVEILRLYNVAADTTITIKGVRA